MSIESLAKTEEPKAILYQSKEVLENLGEADQAVQKNYLEGRPNRVKTAKGTQLQTNLAIIEAADLIASHDALGNANPAYPQELQPRDRSRQSSQQQIHRIAGELDPDSLGRSNRADSGAPIIGPDLVVESGNGRTIAIKLAYQQGKADEYKEWILENAEYFGVNPEKVAQMKQPVLVRVRKTDVDRAQFAVEANQDDKLSYSATERAKSDAKRITGGLLELFNPDDRGDLLASSNMKFIQGFLTSLGEHEAAQYMTTDGKPTQALVMRIKAAIFSKAYNDDRLLEMVADQTKPDLQNVLNGLSLAAPKFIEAQAINQTIKGQLEDISSGIVDGIEKSLDKRIVDAILDATNVIEKAKQNNQAVAEYVDQLGLFGDLPEGVPELAVFISNNTRSAKKLSMAFKAMAEFAEKNAVDNQTFNLFGEPEPVSIKDAVAYANSKLAEEYGDKAQINFFDDAIDFEGRLDRMQQRKYGEPEAVTKDTLLANLAAVDAMQQPLTALRKALDLVMFKGTEPAFSQINPIVNYTTKKGKVLQGVVIPFDVIKYKRDAQELDPYTFMYERSGWFVRLKHLADIDDQFLTPEQINLKRGTINATYSASGSPVTSEMGNERNQGNPIDGRQDAGNMAGQSGTADGTGGGDGNSDTGLSEGNAASGRSGGNRGNASGRKRGIAATGFTADDSQRSNLSDEPRPHARAKRDRSIVQSAKTVRADLTGKALLQLEAEGSPTEWGDIENIRASLPYLLSEQQDDVLKAEKRLLEENHNGILFTNGTGTGKTFTGLGAVKRFANAGKKNILIISMNDKIVRDFVKSAKALHLDVYQLQGITDNGGEEHSIVATTYANFGQNRTLADKDWDLIVVDESHNLMQSQEGKVTAALHKLRALTGHHAGFYTWFDDRFRGEEPPRTLVPVPVLDDEGKEVKNPDGTTKVEMLPQGPYEEGPERDAWYEKQGAMHEQWRKTWNQQPNGRTKVIFLSATPWSYVKTIDWAEGYLFHFVEPEKRWQDEKDGGSYNSGDDRERFYMSHFGYTMRYNKLTRPDGKVDSGVNERFFAEKLKETGAMSGRELNVPFDYDRKFVLVKSAVGQEIDRGIAILWEEKDDAGRLVYSDLLRDVLTRFDYLSRERLLEAIKADAAVEQIKKQIALNRKVVVFHDYNDGGGFSPFNFESGRFMNDKSEAQYERFRAAYPELVNLDLSFNSPIDTLTSHFPNALLFNGRISKGQRAKNADLFNTDKNGYNLIIVQSDAGATGISFHDTTGVHQRVIYNLGLPKKPAKLRQTEGRIYRVGQASNAIQRYMTTGTKWETEAFANVIAQRAETVDNLAKGEDAVVSIRDAIIQAYESAEYFEPSLQDGIGGKAYDEENARIAKLSPFQKSLTFYYNKGKNRDSRQNKIGTDWYATPEPLGLKMMQWAGVHKGDDVLEPSAGDGAIGRWIPADANGTMIEPSLELASRAQMANTSAKIERGSFEDHNTIIKYDAVVMNPPFGHAGALALKHVIKACKHLREGGRVVALVPRSPNLDKGLDDFLASYDGKEFYLTANILLPASTFVNANTSVNTRIIILERHEKPETAPDMRNMDFSGAESVEDLFEQIEHASLPPRRLRQDELLMEYGLVLSPFRSSHILTGVGVKTPQIREVLLANRFVYEVTNDPDSLECSARHVKSILQSLKDAGVEKLMPHSYDGYDGWQHDGIHERILVKDVKVDLKKYVRLEKKPSMKTPIVVWDKGNHYQLLVGYERFKLAMQSEDALIPAIVVSEQYVMARQTLQKAYRATSNPLDPEVFAQHLFDVLDEEAVALLA